MLKPLSNNLVIKGTELKSQSGIVIPESAQLGRPATGEVIAVGEKVKGVKVGDKVLVKGYMVDDVEIDKKKYMICQDDAIIGIVQE